MEEFNIKVENVIVFVFLNKEIQLNKIMSNIENAEYEPEKLPGLLYRISEPRSAALIFPSGKIVCTGTKNIKDAKISMQKVMDRLRKVGISVPREFTVKVENIIASSMIEAELDLEEISSVLENAEYKPGKFPGLIYKIDEPKVVLLIFRSGKIICTGAHRFKDIHKALDKLKEKLESIGIKVKPA